MTNNANLEEIAIEELNLILDRIIGFIVNCDTKVSFLLSSLGVVMTILFTIKPIKFEVLKSLFANAYVLSLGYWTAIIGIICLIIFIWGVYILLNVIRARTECLVYTDSVIFFGHIEKNEHYLKFADKINPRLLSEYRQDLISQIFTNSKICSTKFYLFNVGLRLSTYPLPILFLCWAYLF